LHNGRLARRLQYRSRKWLPVWPLPTRRPDSWSASGRTCLWHGRKRTGL
jgi:hypothetical protein